MPSLAMYDIDLPRHARAMPSVLIHGYLCWIVAGDNNSTWAPCSLCRTKITLQSDTSTRIVL